MEQMNLEFFFNLEREGKKSVIDFCIKMGFIAGSYECPECKKPMKLTCNQDRTHDGFVWYCKHKSKINRSVRSGSWFQESRLSLIMMLKLAYLWIKRTTHTWIADELKTTQNTVCEWMSFFRRVCVNAIKKEGIFIGGPNETVEIDAKSFSNVKNKKGLETWVFGGVERSTKNCFLEIIESGEKDEIISILQKYVRPGTIIISDNWKGFDCLESNGYMHQKVCKTYGFKDSVTGAHKNNILCLWSKVKKIVSYRISNDQFDTYLAEVMWRRLHKNNTQGLLIAFFKILRQIFAPQVRDDPTCILRRTDIKKKKIEDCIKIETQSQEVNVDNNEGETQLKEENGVNNERETQSQEVNTDNNEGETQLKEENGVNNERETQLMEVNGNNYKEQGESVCDLQIDNQFIGEIEVPLVVSGDSLSEDEFESENGSQKKRQKTTESLDI